jgi:pro-apoptotic serine protease NMA111
LSDAHLRFAGSAFLEGKIKGLSPDNGWAVIAYDASLVDGPMKSAKLSTKPVEVGATMYFVGINAARQLEETKTRQEWA